MLQHGVIGVQVGVAVLTCPRERCRPGEEVEGTVRASEDAAGAVERVPNVRDDVIKHLRLDGVARCVVLCHHR